MTPNYSVYFGLMEKKKMKSALECNPQFLGEKKRNPRIVFELIRYMKSKGSEFWNFASIFKQSVILARKFKLLGSQKMDKNPRNKN